MTKQATVTALPNLMSFPAMCAALKISRKKADNLISNPASDFPRPFKMGNERFFRPEDIEAWITAKANAANADRQSTDDPHQQTAA